MSLSARRIFTKGIEAIHVGWIIVGITLLTLLLLEVGVRVRQYAAVRRSAGPVTFAAGDPHAESWFADFQREFEATRVLRWRPYVYYRRAPSPPGRYITIDSLGHRRTPQPTQPATPVARVFLYGGSTMWGEPQREDRTIAAEIARRLQPLAGNGARIEVTNLAETGYVFTQELIQLQLDLRAGLRPDVVVFYDGVNDVPAAVQTGVPGEPQNEQTRAADFALGRALTRATYGDAGEDARALSVLGGLAFKRLALVQWAQARKPMRVRPFIAADSAARGIAHVYGENALLVEMLAARYGFTPVYVWQPNFHSTEKRLNAHEQTLMGRVEREPFHNRIREIHRRVPVLLDSVMHGVAPDRFVDAASLFKNDPQPVFVDVVGHTTESAIPAIVDSFWPTLEQATRQALERGRARAKQTTRIADVAALSRDPGSP
jgi:lysophospholipase L1-like esterase